ncbi:Hypothetical predicted protein [Olea europaea subsp. europaea]|uniref:Uncharacterized protein n=1 Tax=Olea europaea subsp. europaea TaxID=158383 RepID=A0A8S0VC16_OLEEU|nr:Hypothetical predicted protein [Olea europaea subsp. europaea]
MPSPPPHKTTFKPKKSPPTRTTSASCTVVQGFCFVLIGGVGLLHTDWYSALPMKSLLRRHHRHFTTTNSGDSQREKCCAAGDLLRGGVRYSASASLYPLHYSLIESTGHVKASATNVERGEIGRSEAVVYV